MTQSDASPALPKTQLGRLLWRYNPAKRPRQARRLWTIIATIVALFGVLGYAIPAVISRMWQ